MIKLKLSSNRRNPWFLAAGLLVASAPALAEDLVGPINVVGSGINSETLIKVDPAAKGLVVCASDTEKRLRHLASLTVKVSGDWRLGKTGAKQCFVAADFSVLKMVSGRDAVVGKVSQKDGVFTVQGADGKTLTLTDLPDGLKKLDGQQVILDVRAIASPGGKDSANAVVTYQLLP